MPSLELVTSGLGVLGDQLGDVVKNAVVATLVVLGLHALRAARERAPSGPRRVLSVVGTLVVAVTALGVMDHALKNRTATLTTALGRWDHWFLCALLGQLLAPVAPPWKFRALVVTSLVFVGTYAGGPALGLTLAAALVGWAAIRFGLARWPRVALAVQPCVTLGLVAYFAAIRPSDQLLAWQGWGLAGWAMMRHVSFVVEARRGASTRLTDYAYYLLFFPSCFGAMETYDEFASRNIERQERPDLGAALIGAIRGDVLVHAALVVPISQGMLLTATGFAELWGLSLLWFLRAALYLGGVWSMIEAEALLLGVRLRHNFTGILTAQNPSKFWRAWRGTMTHWLIRYVYVPLGGNRWHRTRNIFAAFVVSTVWHAAGVLFVLDPTAGGIPFVPIGTWGLLNFVGVAAHSAWRRRWPAGTWLPESSLVSRAVKTLLTLCFGSLIVTVLGFPRDHLSEFPRFVCTLAGLARFCDR